ncbi:MAG TPA: hypothetical protein VK617_00950, partial [Gemmatimonadaceae bacterium]|nr:hypothetical protein [Gemmatimonadaceae bacterium]
MVASVISAPLGTHWLLDIVQSEQPLGEKVTIDSQTSITVAWRNVAQGYGMTQAQLAALVAAHFHLSVADLSAAQPHAA